jgi:excinuclease ABC subunit C
MALRAKVKDLPRTPGVYLLKDASGRVLYVGKAKSLRHRVSSYLRDDQVSPKIAAMVRKVCDVDYVETDSEVEALLAEQRLVKDIRPKYNTELKDDKSFPCLEITLADDFPAVRFVRRRGDSKSAYYGPFTDAKALRRAIKALQKIFRFRTCALAISSDDRSRRYARPCLLYHIDCCSAPCANSITRADYRKDVRNLVDFLNGDRDKTLGEMEARMKEASSRLEYERAALFRNRLRALRSLDDAGDVDGLAALDIEPVSPEAGVEDLKERLKLKRAPRVIEGIDISSLSGREATGSKVVFVNGIPCKNAYRRYRIRGSGRDDYEMIAEVVRRRFSRGLRESEKLPDLLLVDGGQGHVTAACNTLAELGIELSCVGLAKRNEEIFLPRRRRPVRLPSNDSALRMLQCVRDEAHRFARHYHHLLRRRPLKRKGRSARSGKGRRKEA